MSVYSGNGRFGRRPVRGDTPYRLQFLFWRLVVTGTAALLAIGFAAAAGSAVTAYGAAGPASVAPGTVAPSPKRIHQVPAESFLLAAEALYKAAVSGNTFETRLSLKQTEVKLRSLPMQRIASAEGIEALAQSVARMKRSVAAVSTDPQKWVDGAAEIRLAADALAHPQNPLWHEYRKVLREDVVLLTASIEKSGVSATSKAYYERLKGHYQLIRTSVLLHSDPFLTERADSILRYVQRLLANAKTDTALLAGLAEPLQDSMDALFPGRGNERAAVVPPVAAPPWGWSAFMGTFIVSVLTWVGWRRYHAAGPVTPRETLPQERRERR